KEGGTDPLDRRLSIDTKDPVKENPAEPEDEVFDAAAVLATRRSQTAFEADQDTDRQKQLDDRCDPTGRVQSGAREIPAAGADGERWIERHRAGGGAGERHDEA